MFVRMGVVEWKGEGVVNKEDLSTCLVQKELVRSEKIFPDVMSLVPYATSKNMCVNRGHFRESKVRSQNRFASPCHK